jgi:hypothetical protein
VVGPAHASCPCRRSDRIEPRLPYVPQRGCEGLCRL